MDILLLGGTGAMGTHITTYLANDNHQITITSRSERNSTESVKYLKGNAKDIEFLKSVCTSKKWDAIVDFMVYTTDELRERVELLLASTKQYVFISSARVYAESDEKITENSPRLLDVCSDKDYLATDEYALAKAREEDVLYATSQSNWTIVRPSLTYGENRLQLGAYGKENWLYRALHGRSIVFSEDLMDKYYTMSYGKDVAAGIAALIGNDSAIGEVFHIVYNKSLQWKDILDIYVEELKHIGINTKVVIVPQCTNLKLPYARYQVLYGRYFNRHFNNEKIQMFVDTSGWVEPDAGLRDCLNSFLQNPSFLKIDWHKEALIDRAAKEWTPLKEISGYKTKLKYLYWRVIGK